MARLVVGRLHDQPVDFGAVLRLATEFFGGAQFQFGQQCVVVMRQRAQLAVLEGVHFGDVRIGAPTASPGVRLCLARRCDTIRSLGQLLDSAVGCGNARQIFRAVVRHQEQDRRAVRGEARGRNARDRASPPASSVRRPAPATTASRFMLYASSFAPVVCRYTSRVPVRTPLRPAARRSRCLHAVIVRDLLRRSALARFDHVNVPVVVAIRILALFAQERDGAAVGRPRGRRRLRCSRPSAPRPSRLAMSNRYSRAGCWVR